MENRSKPRAKLLKNTHPELFARILPELNPGVDLENLTYGSQTRVIALCPKKGVCQHHRCEASVYTLTYSKGSGCPFCTGRKLCPCDSLAGRYKMLVPLFSHERNPITNLESVFCTSKDVYWWNCAVAPCECHVYESSIRNMTRGIDLSGPLHNPCRYCMGQLTCPHDSFAWRYPQLFDMFMQAGNPGLDPFTLSCQSPWKPNWRCPTPGCRQIFPSRVFSMVDAVENGNIGCPFCAGLIATFENSVAYRFPQLFVEFVSEQSDGIDILAVSPGSSKAATWRCLVNTEHPHYRTKIYQRTTRGDGCPKCRQSKNEKLCEQILIELQVAYETQVRFADCRDKNPLAYDFGIESSNALIEIDGEHHFFEVFFSGENRNRLPLIQKHDRIKNQYALDIGRHLLRVSFSEMSQLRVHVELFLRDVRNATSPLHRFIGKEYRAVTQA